MLGGKILSTLDRFWFEGIFPLIERKDGIQKKEKGKQIDDIDKKLEEAVSDTVGNGGHAPTQ
jgi:hypothetical protein